MMNVPTLPKIVRPVIPKHTYFLFGLNNFLLFLRSDIFTL